MSENIENKESEVKDCNYEDIKNYQIAFDCFVQRFLKEKKSIFRLDSDDEILNKNSIQYLIENFVNNGYGGKAEFIEKMKIQLVGNEDIEPKFPENITDEEEKNIIQKKDAVEVLAHIIWLWRLVPSNAKMQTTIQSVKEVLELNENFKNINLDKNPFFNDKIKGIASTGTYYNTNKPSEIAFVIIFLDKLVNDTENKDFIALLNDNDNEVHANVKITGKWDWDKDGNIVEGKNGSSTKSASIRHALLHFFDPENYEAIVSNDHKEKIVAIFEDLIYADGNKEFKPKIDWEIKCIKSELGGDNYNKDIYFFYQPNIRKLWDNDSIEVNKNIIYYGVPGTGKTYGVMKEIEEQEGIEYKFVQFHPSYGYEDFIEGIKPIKSNSNQNINLQLVNGEFKKMCIDAFAELKKAKEEGREAKRFYFIADEINRAELSRVFGELLLCLEDDKRLRYDEEGNLIGVKIKTQNSNLWEEEHCIIKENSEYFFGIPENLYFIGTMNDIDRSVDSFDMALRRRFTGVRMSFDEKPIRQKYGNHSKISDYIKACYNLNKFITVDKDGFNLGEDYELGHSYFLKPNDLNQEELDKVWDKHIAPLLTEYLRAFVSQSEITEKLKDAKEKFKI